MNQVDKNYVLEHYPDAVSHNSFGTAWWVEGNFQNLSGYHTTEEDAWLYAAKKTDELIPNDFQRHMAVVSRTVAKWPTWKQNVLGSANRSTGQRREILGCRRHS